MSILRSGIVLFALILICTAASAQVTSNFSSNDEGWTVPDAKVGTFTYNTTGGNPTGNISAQTFGSVPLGPGLVWYPFYFVSPGAFNGNKFSYYGGGLSFDISQTSTAATIQYPAVILTSAAGIVLYYYPNTLFAPATNGAWTTFEVPFSTTSGEWKTTNSPTGTAAASTQMQSVLSSLQNIQIQGLYRNANLVGRIDNVNLRPPLTVTTQPASTAVCLGQTATFTSAGGNNPTITYQWQRFTAGIGYLDISNGGGYSNVTTSTLSINTTGNFGAGQYRARISGVGGVDDTFSNGATLTINALPTAPTTTDGSRCGTGTVTLTAAGGTAGSYRWYTVATGGAAIGGQTNATYTTGSLSITTDYYVSIYNGTCESTRTSVTAIINNTTPPTTTDGSRCGNGTVALSASGGTAGQYRWYAAASGGPSLNSAATYTTPTLTGTTNYWVSINNGTCESTRTMVTATVTPIPAAPGFTGASGCNPSSVTLTATGGTAGQYRWYTVPTGGTAIVGQTNSTYTTPSLSVTTNYYVSIDNGSCEGARSTVTATITNLTPPTTTDGSRCGTGAVTLTAAGGTAGQYRWYNVATGGAPIGGQTNATYTTGSLSVTANYYVSIYNGTCESTRTIVTANINNTTPPTTTDGSRCGPGTVVLTAAGGTTGQYRWYTVATGGTALPGETNNTYTTPSISGTNNYWVSINNGTCESTRTLVTASINTVPAAPGVTGASGCNPSSLTLSATGGTAGQYRWYTVATGGTAIPAQTSATYNTGSLTVTTNYYVAINNTTCEGPRTLVVATINTVPGAPAVTPGSRCGTGTVTLNASGGTAGQYRWYTVATGGTAIPAQTNSAYTTPSIGVTTNYYVSINNGTCESPRTLVVATINNNPTAPGITGAAGCNPSALTLNATGGTAGQYRWYTLATGGTSIPAQTNSTYTTPSLGVTTNYYVSINNGTCESTRTLVIATINNLPTAPGVTGGSGCAPSTVTLTANGGAAGQYRWYTLATGGAAIPAQTNSTYTTPSLNTTTNYYVSINNGTCESARVLIVATVNSSAPAPTVTDGVGCIPSSVALSASGASNGQYRWYDVATGGIAINGETNSTYNTPVLSASATYYVSINNGCEGSRTAVTATLNDSPSAPTATGDFSCTAASIKLTASGGSAGQYRWYTASTGGTAITGKVNSTYETPEISSTTTYYVSISNGTCESSRVAVTATIGGPTCQNTPPAIEKTSGSTKVGGIVTIDLTNFIEDDDNNIDLSTLKIVSQPASGAVASIDNETLSVNYGGLTFQGQENITISICDSFGACGQQLITLEVFNSIYVYNAVSPNKDGKNDLLYIDGIDILDNHVTIFNRWGDLVWEGSGYNNNTVVFAGISKNNAELPSGTYFYKIEFPGSATKTETGYLSLKR